jgi:hypothetical protein
MVITRIVKHTHYLHVPLPELMVYVTGPEMLLNVPPDSRMSVVDNDCAGHQVVTFSWETTEELS